jgi:dihydrofolate reductase
MSGLEMIWAESADKVIGVDNGLPWRHFSEDVEHFRRFTTGKTVIMGRKTWDSLPTRVRPLPDRENIVISRKEGFEAPGAIVASTVEEALQKASLQPVVMGGKQLYDAAMKYATFLHVTTIRQMVDFGDPEREYVYAPKMGEEWELFYEIDRLLSHTELEYAVSLYRKARITSPDSLLVR